MSTRKKVGFVWQGITGRYGYWKDGLYLAMKHLEKVYDVSYYEPTDNIEADVVLYWEAPCTINGQFRDNYLKVKNLPIKKALLFAGGPIQKEWLDGFDHVFVESKINAEELAKLGVPHSTAFGINEEIMKPMDLPKEYVGIHHGTCASWKRQWLVGEALKDKALIVGRNQESDSYPFRRCKEMGSTVLDEKEPEELATLINKSQCVVQTSDYWGGGQRCTLEGLACNLPVVVMEDSPKNREYIEESGCGVIVSPDVGNITRGVNEVIHTDYGNRPRDYIMSKWTSRHYADALIKVIDTL